jgi:nucleotide-binding universal stress UspA family protein
MSYRTILYAIDEDPIAESHMDHAARLARAFEARLVGVSCHRPSPWPSDGAVAFIEGDPLTIELRAAEEAADARESVFLHRCRLAGFASPEAIRDDTEMVSAICTRALFADLVVMPQPSPSASGHAERRRRADAILQHSPRPVLMLPHSGRFDAAAGPALVAWDGSDGAARAASAALPLLRRAGAVHLVRAFDPRAEDGDTARSDAERAAAWLSAHGLDVRIETFASDLPAGEALLSQGAALGAQLLVMGAWGHRRIVERVLGGATRTMVDSMTAPVLFAH